MLTPPYARLRRDLDQTQINVALNTLRQIVEAGFSVLSMADGWADHFTDQDGIDGAVTSGMAYDAAGDFWYLTGSLPASSPAFGGSVVGVNAANGVDGDAGTYAQVTTLPNWSGTAALADRLIYTADLGSVKSLTEIALTGQFNYAEANPAFALIYSEDGSAWTSAGSADFAVNSVTETITLTGSFSARYIGIAGAQNNYGGTGQDFRIDELRGSDGSETGSLVSVDFSAEAQPSRGRVIALLDYENDPDAGTDFDIGMSRDDGVTFTDGALTDRGVFLGTVRIVTADIDLSAQDSGTDMRWRVTNSGVVVPVHAAFFQWGV